MNDGTKSKSMKTIFTLIASVLFGVTVFAADVKPVTSLTIRSIDRGDIRVVIDGRRFEPNDNYMRLRNLQSGYHKIKVYRERTGGFISIFGRRYEVVYNSSLFIRPRTNVEMTIDRFGHANVFMSRSDDDWGRDDRGFRDGRDDRNDRGFNQQKGQNFDNNHDFDFGRGHDDGDYNDRDRDQRDFDHGNGNGYGNGYGNGHDNGYDNGNNYGYRSAMSDYEFGRVLSSIQKEWFETNKVKSASQVINTSWFTAAQVKQMLQLFNFESNKLDLAKQAYAKTVDQQNYFIINDVFSFNSSKDELMRYTRDYR